MTRHATLQTCSPVSPCSPVSRMDSCWQDDEDLCDIRSDASLLRLLAAEGGLLPRAPADMLGPARLPAWLHWTLGALYSITGEKKHTIVNILEARKPGVSVLEQSESYTKEVDVRNVIPSYTKFLPCTRISPFKTGGRHIRH